MENRKNRLQLSKNSDIPGDYEQIYFPCGSLSSFQESIIYTEDEKDNEIQKETLPDEQSLILNELKIIDYDEQSLPCESFADPNFYDFTVNDLKIPKNNQSLEENYRKLYQDYKILEALYKTCIGSKKTYTEISSITDLQGSHIENLRRDQKILEKLVKDLKAENLANIKEIQELQKSLKFYKHESSALREKTNQQEALLLKIKLNTDDILDEEGTNKTSRISGSDSYSNILNKLELVKKKVNKNSKKNVSVSNKETIIKEISSQFKKKNLAVPGIEAGLYELGDSKKYKIDEEPRTERPKSTSAFDHENYEKITYKDVLRDLREITDRANKALKKTNMQRKSSCSTLSNTPYKLETERYKLTSVHEGQNNEKIRRINFRK